MIDAHDRFDALADEARSAAKRIAAGTRDGSRTDGLELHQIFRKGSERVHEAEGIGTQ
jgi:hypothetical protein